MDGRSKNFATHHDAGQPTQMLMSQLFRLPKSYGLSSEAFFAGDLLAKSLDNPNHARHDTNLWQLWKQNHQVDGALFFFGPWLDSLGMRQCSMRGEFLVE